MAATQGASVSLVIAAAQSASAAGDLSGNVARHLRFATMAAHHRVQLLIFPELSLTGYELSLARAHTVAPESRELDPLRKLAARARMTIVAGAPVRNSQDELHIGALALCPDGAVVTYTKVHTHHSEESVFRPGLGGPALRIEDSKVALAICRDAKQPQHAAGAAARGANLYAACVMVVEEEYEGKAAVLRSHAREHGMAVLMANYSGETGGSVSAGKSALWSEDGELAVASTGSEEALVIGRKENGAWKGMVLPLPLA